MNGHKTVRNKFMNTVAATSLKGGCCTIVERIIGEKTPWETSLINRKALCRYGRCVAGGPFEPLNDNDISGCNDRHNEICFLPHPTRSRTANTIPNKQRRT